MKPSSQTTLKNSKENTPTESQFIAWGLQKEGWEFVDPDVIMSFLDNGRLLDVKSPEFLERFYYYFDWYWRNQRLK